MAKLPSLVRLAIELVVFVAIALLLSVGLRTFVMSPYVIPSESMEHTLEVGDMVFAEKVSYATGTAIQQGDIVTFENTLGEVDEAGNPTIFVKRCIAVAGQTVTIKDGNVYVDGKAFDDSFVKREDDGTPEPTYGGTFLGDVTCADDGEAREDSHSIACDGADATCYEYTVPEGEIWVMGDNRTESYDSRYFGSVPTENVTGRVFMRYWPLDSLGLL